jgi:hypothetical protein
MKKHLTKPKKRQYNVHMNGITVTRKPGSAKKILVEMDARHLKRFAAAFGLFSDEFLESVKRAEQDYRAGRIIKIKSLRDLRKKSA